VADFNYLTIGEVIEMQRRLLEVMGQPPAPLRDEGGLEAALMRARMAGYYEEADLIRQAALMAVGVSQAQAFLDGNKRTAYAAMDTFLRLNGYKVPKKHALDVARQLEAVAERQDALSDATDRFEVWLRDHVEALLPR
jgi:death on curing protein